MSSSSQDGSGPESKFETAEGATLDLGHEIYNRHTAPGIVSSYVATKIMRQMNLSMNRLPVLHEIAHRHAMTDLLLPGAWQSLPFVMNHRSPDAVVTETEGNAKSSDSVNDNSPKAASAVAESNISRSANGSNVLSHASSSSNALAKNELIEVSSSPEIHLQRKLLSPIRHAEDVSMHSQPPLWRTGPPSANSELSSTTQGIGISNSHVLSTRPFIFRSSSTPSEQAPFRDPFTVQRRTSVETPHRAFLSSALAFPKSVGMTTNLSRAVSSQKETTAQLFHPAPATHPSSLSLVLPPRVPAGQQEKPQTLGDNLAPVLRRSTQHSGQQDIVAGSPEALEIGLHSSGGQSRIFPDPVLSSDMLSSGLENSTLTPLNSQPPLIMRATGSRSLPGMTSQITPVGDSQMSQETKPHGQDTSLIKSVDLHELTLQRVPAGVVGAKRLLDVTSPASVADQRELQEGKLQGLDALLMKTVDPDHKLPETVLFRKPLALQRAPAEDDTTTVENLGMRHHQDSGPESPLPFASARLERPDHETAGNTSAESETRPSSARLNLPSLPSTEPAPLAIMARRYSSTPTAPMVVARAADAPSGKPEMIWRSVAKAGDGSARTEDFAGDAGGGWSRYGDGQYIARQMSPSSQSSPSSQPSMQIGGGSPFAASQPSEGNMDIAHIAEQVSRLISKQLLVESERRGLSKWQ